MANLLRYRRHSSKTTTPSTVQQPKEKEPEAAAASSSKPASTNLFGAPAGRPAGDGTGPASEQRAVAPIAPQGPLPFIKSSAPTASAPASSAAPRGPLAPPETAPAMFKGRTIEEALVRVEEQLEQDVKMFKAQAAEVRKWDMMLIRNGDQVRLVTVYLSTKRKADILISYRSIESMNRSREPMSRKPISVLRYKLSRRDRRISCSRSSPSRKRQLVSLKRSTTIRVTVLPGRPISSERRREYHTGALYRFHFEPLLNSLCPTGLSSRNDCKHR